MIEPHLEESAVHPGSVFVDGIIAADNAIGDGLPQQSQQADDTLPPGRIDLFVRIGLAVLIDVHLRPHE